jgi:hypothetical protein
MYVGLCKYVDFYVDNYVGRYVPHSHN